MEQLLPQSSIMASLTRLRSGPTLVLQALPPKTFVGIDLFSFTSSPSFRGLSALPPGPHFIYTGTDASLSIRHGHWFQINLSSPNNSPERLIYHWNTDLECLEQVQDASQETLAGDSDRVSELGLVSYSDIAAASSHQYENGRGDDVGTVGTVQQWTD